MIRHYCVWIGRTVIFCRQTINYNWFLGHLKYLTWVQREGHKAFDIVCLWHLSAPSLLVGIFQKTGYVSNDGTLAFAEGI